MSTLRRFRVAKLDLEAAEPVALDADVRRHLAVIRAAAGDRLFLFDGDGNEVEAEIVQVDAESATVRVVAVIEQQTESPLQCCLIQAIPSRWKRMDTIIRQTTELGVQRIVPVVASRSQHAKVTPGALARRAERWQKIAVSAAEQSHRVVVPTIDAPCGLAEIAWQAIPRPLLIAEVSAEPFIDGAVPHPTTPCAVSVMIGPEGGWSAEESSAATMAGAQPIGLGPRVLRADTAGVVALAVLQSRWGDLRRSPDISSGREARGRQGV